MNLGDLLQLLRVGILNDRSARVSGSSDYLWTDATLVSYINEAQRRFAVKGLVLRDNKTDAATLVTLVSGQSSYVLHESVLSVMAVVRVADTTELFRMGRQSPMRGPVSDGWGGAVAPGTGQSLAFLTDESLSDTVDGSLSRITMKVYPTPAAAQDGEQLRLRVIRKPIETLDVCDLGAIPEIPEDHHIEMLDYAAYLALRIVDDDAGNPKRAADFFATFESNVRDARAEVMRKMFSPIGWGSGQGGFAWSN